MADTPELAKPSYDAPMYELMYIINPVLNEEQTKEIVQRVTAYLTDNGAQVAQVQELGSQRLAYPIEKKRNGYYVVVNFTLATGDILQKVERALIINDDVMRHMVLRYDAKMLRYYEQTKGQTGPTPAAKASAPAVPA